MPALYLDSRVGVEEYIVLSETMVTLPRGMWFAWTLAMRVILTGSLDRPHLL